MFWYSLYDVTSVGMFTCPFTVGPSIAASAGAGGAGERYVWLFVLITTPGDTIVVGIL
jgi:hypothetical protein